MSDVRRLADAKAYLQKRIEELEKELAFLKLMLSMVDEALSKESFTKASELPRGAGERVVSLRPATEAMGRLITEYTITSREGRELAKFIVYDKGVLIKPLIDLPIDSPPFRSFFLAKILDGYRRKDDELVTAGSIMEEEAFDYEIDEEGGLVREIRVYNYRERRRLDELRSALRWTLNRVLERMR